ncbi:MAG: MATE family efflux transporter [Clostridiales Family XIII bacterium]|jgi:putative MATE family efflux protein|nr:MATE family efflux transporter [Clostridiales Family XIII bacterium]
MNEENKMGTLPVGKLLFSMSLPPMLSMLLGALYNIIDSIFVAQLSVTEKPLTAVTLAFPAQMFMMAICIGLGVGNASLISRRLGEKKQDEADSAATHGFFLALVCWVIFAAFGLFGTEPFLRLFTSDAEILSMAVTYLRIVAVGSVFMCFSICIERIMQATGDMIHPMIFNSVGAGLNAILAPIFIIGQLGAPRLGIMGAGLVAVTGQCVAMVIAVVMFVKNEHAVSVHFRGFRVKGRTIGDILAVGAPSIIMVSIQSFLISGLNAILLYCLPKAAGDMAVAVLGVYFRIQTFVVLPVIGMGQGALPIIGYNFGARNRRRLMATFKLAIKIAMIIMAVGVALFWLLPEQIMSLFSASPDMMDMGVHALRAISISYIPAAFTIVCVTLFQATAHGIFAMIISIVRQLGFILPLAYILLANFGVDSVWYAFPIAEIAALAMSATFLRRVYNKQIKQLPDGSLTV